MDRIKILIADDHRDFRRIVHEFLDRLPNVSVVGEATDSDNVVEEVGKLHPDVVLMDIAMGSQNSVEAIKTIKARWPGTKVYVATMHDNPMYRLQAQEANADGFFLKSTLKPSLEATFGTPVYEPKYWTPVKPK